MTTIERIGAWLLQGVIVGGLIFLLVTGCQPKAPVAETPIEEIEVTTDNYTYNVPLASELQLYISSLCEDYSIDPALVMAMIAVESYYNSNTIGDGGDSIGLMQVQPKWHQERMERLGVTDLSNPYQNVTVGVDYIAEKLNEGQGLEWALMAYNGGNTYANEMTAEGKTSDYAIKVMAEAYRLTYAKNYGGIRND